MYLIQDTGEAVSQHVLRGFSSEPLTAYLEFWGVMQAIIIQQDAVVELHQAIMGKKPHVETKSAWQELRDIRNICAGHPARRAHGLPAPQRSFMGRSFGNYDRIQYELWDARSGQTSHPSFNLRKLMGAYDVEAEDILLQVLARMKSNWP
jgi:hypothetical protein